MLYASSRTDLVRFRPFSVVYLVYVALLWVRFVMCPRSLRVPMQQEGQTVRKLTVCTYSVQMPPRFKDYRNVPRTQMVGHVTSEPTFIIHGIWKIVLKYRINHCFVGVLHRHVQRPYPWPSCVSYNKFYPPGYLQYGYLLVWPGRDHATKIRSGRVVKILHWHFVVWIFL